MIGQDKLKTEAVNLCFENLAMLGGGEVGGWNGGMKVEGGVIDEWKDIPTELLWRILPIIKDDRAIIAAAGVCSGWRDAVCLGVTHLSLSWCKKNMNELVLSLAPKFTRLQSLVLRQDRPQLLDTAVENIANSSHDLQELDLSKSFKLTDHSLYALAHGCPNLTKLNISGCLAFSDAALEYLTGHCQSLRCLNLCGCVKAVSDNALQAIGHNCSHLRYLNLGWCENVTDAGVIGLAYGCPDLEALDLCGCVLITDDSVVALANRCFHLKSLVLYYCRNITDTAMYSLAYSRGKYKREKLETASKKNDEEGLVNLNISQCTALTPPAVQAVCDTFPALHTCPGKHSLNISGCLKLASVHCACSVQPHRIAGIIPRAAH